MPMISLMEITTQPYDEISPELQPGERVLWSGRPDPQRLLLRGDLLFVPFSLMWGGFALFWEYGVLTTPSADGGFDWFMALWGIPFVLVGLYMIAGRLVARRVLARQTAYAITDRRAITVRPTLRGGRDIQAIWLGGYPTNAVSSDRGERGTITIGTLSAGMNANMVGDPGLPWGGRNSAGATVFWNIAEPQTAKGILDGAIANLGRAVQTAQFQASVPAR